MKLNLYLKLSIWWSLFLLRSTLCGAQIPEIETGNIQQKIYAYNTSESIIIDGLLDEASWTEAQKVTSFINFNPVPHEKAREETVVSVLYNDDAIYVGAHLYMEDVSLLLNEYSLRDDDRSNTDQFTVILDTYRSQQNATVFSVMSSGVQYDALYFLDDKVDKNWDVVWESKVSKNDKGWFVEMKIPYSALRFPDAEEQIWNINFIREVRYAREECSWNPIDPFQGDQLQQMGQLIGIKSVKPPIRLSLTPYLANVLVNNFDKSRSPKSSWSNSIGGGLDLKYGINQAFTLDMTLVPDFSEVQSDDAVLNLGPFEVAFDENRPFFTEGTELFNKNNLFYSRRIGGRPILEEEVESLLENGEVVLENPQVAQLINATKLTGRTNSGLGIGFFNAIEGESRASIEKEDGTKRSLITGPTTNYNMLIFDQLVQNGGNIYLMNTNVWREGLFHDSNVSSGGLTLKNKNQSYQLAGSGTINQTYFPDSLDVGHAYNMRMSKIAGKWTGSLGFNIESDNYDVNDLGLLFSPNEKSFNGRIRFTDFDGFGNLARAQSTIDIIYSRLFRPDKFVDFALLYNSFFLLRSFNAFGFDVRYEPVETFDYFDPRTEDFSRYLLYPKNYGINGFVSTDYRKRFAFDLRGGYRHFYTEENRNRFSLNFSPRFRLSDHFNVILGIGYEHLENDRGYVTKDNEAIIMGDRDRKILINTINARYIFNANLGVALRVRHYWSTVSYNQFYELNEQSDLVDSGYDGKDNMGNNIHDISQSFFNLDCVLRWRFAPGSDLLFTWKTSITESDNLVNQSYWKETTSLLEAPVRNSFTLKVLYFLDYHTTTSWFDSPI